MIVLGRIVAPFGVRGWLRVHSFGDDPLAWQTMPQWWLAPTADAPAASWRPYVPEMVKQHADGVVAKLVGVDGRTGAESLAGCFIGAMRNDLPPAGPGEYYWNDLIGLAVVNLQDQSLGRVTSLLETGAHDVLVVVDEDRERLLPFVEHVVKAVDVHGGMIRVDWDVDW